MPKAVAMREGNAAAVGTRSLIGDIAAEIAVRAAAGKPPSASRSAMPSPTASADRYFVSRSRSLNAELAVY